MAPDDEKRIASPQNPKVKEWAALLDKKNRDRSGRFLLEGVHLVQEALQSGAAVEVIAYDEQRGVPAELKPLLARAGDVSGGCDIYAATAAVLAKCAGTDTPPPVVAVAAKPPVDRAALLRPGALVVALDGVRDPGNAGTLIRSADAVGADAVVLGRGCVDLFNPKTVRSTMGSLFHLPVVEADLAELLPEAKRAGARLIGTSLQAAANCYDADWTGGVWLLLGSESQGLSPEVLAQMDESVLIPMRGKAESLNVAMAGTVLLYEAMRQRHY